MIERERRTVERRIKEARFPAVTSLDSFDFTAIPSLNNTLVLELARSEYVARRENVIALGNSGAGKNSRRAGARTAHLPEGPRGRLHHAAALVLELHEARDEKRLLRLQHQLAGYKLLIVDELGYSHLALPCVTRCGHVRRESSRQRALPGLSPRRWSPCRRDRARALQENPARRGSPMASGR
jgi:DNA replication protein DnaC